MEKSNIFDTTIRDRPEEWTAGVWKEVYDFAPGGGGMANWTDLLLRVSSGTKRTLRMGIRLEIVEMQGSVGC